MAKTISILLGGLLAVPSVLCFPTQVPLVVPSLDTRDASREFCGELNTQTILTTGDDVSESGPGLFLTNHDEEGLAHYFLYENTRDDRPWKHVQVAQGERLFVSVCPSWQGRVVRGTPEVNLDGKPHMFGTFFGSAVASDGAIYGDISFLGGCDGGGSITATDGSGMTRGCLADLLSGAPEAALATKDTGSRVLGPIVSDNPNWAAKNWELSLCDPNEVWIEVDNNGGPVMASRNGRLDVVFSKGRA